MRRFGMIYLLLLVAAGLFAGGSEEGEAVVVYSHRHYEVDQELYDLFTERTGIRVDVVNAGADELIARLDAEGEGSPADLLVTVDAGRLHRATEQGLLQPVESEVLERRVPAHLRDDQNRWFGLTKRARVIVYHPDRVDPAEVARYEDLASDDLGARVAIRSSSNIYNQSLLASIIAYSGRGTAVEWASGVVDNFARQPTGNDRDQMKAVAAGDADLAVVNTYYVGLMATSANEAERRVAETLRVHFPNQEDRGTHINVSGAGVTVHAPNRDGAVQLLEFLVSDEAQRRYAAANFEYPVVEGVAPSDVVAEWGTFTEDRLQLSRLGELNAEAVKVFDEVGWR